MDYFFYALIILFVSYCIGSFPTAYFVVKAFNGKDIRAEGTGNVGAMNTARATGKWYLFLLVTVIDAIKGALPLLIVQKLSIDVMTSKDILLIAATGVIIGHCWSLYFKMRDGRFARGKAIASLIGVLGVLHFNYLLIPWGVAMLIPVIFTGNLFLGQFVGTLVLPIIAFFLTPDLLIIAICISFPVFIKQWPRVIPMLKGKEPRWYWKKK